MIRSYYAYDKAIERYTARRPTPHSGRDAICDCGARCDAAVVQRYWPQLRFVSRPELDHDDYLCPTCDRKRQ